MARKYIIDRFTEGHREDSEVHGERDYIGLVTMIFLVYQRMLLKLIRLNKLSYLNITHHLLINRARIILLIFFLFISLNSFSQTPPYNNYTTKEGLCNSNVYYMLQDKTGYMWFATNNGISRFDGYNFQNYYTTDGLNTNNFTSIAEDSDETLLFSNYDKGINYYKNDKFENYETNFKDPYVIHQSLLFNDTLYFISGSILGICYKNKLQFTRNEGAFVIYSIFCDKKNKYLGTENGLYKLSGLQKENVYIEGLKNTAIYKITADNDGNLLLGCKGIIYKVKEGKIIQTIKLNEEISGNICKLYVDSRNNVWFHPINKGLFVYKGSRIFNIGEKLNLGKTPVNHILEDRDKNIWVSTTGKGVYCFNNLFIEIFTESDGLSNNNISSIQTTESGKTLIGTFDGLNIYDGTKFTKVEGFKSTIVTNYIYGIKKGIKDTYIVSCSTGEREIIENKINNISLVFLNGMSGLEYDFNHYILGGSMNSVNFYLKNGIIDSIKSFHVIGQTRKLIKINEIEKDSLGNLWVGTNQGLCKKTNDIKKYFSDNSVLNSSISFIRRDSRNRIWITAEKGIGVIIPPDDKIVSLEKTNLADFSSSNSIDFDNSGNIWIATNKGLYRISEEEFLENKIDSVLFFDETNGLPSSEIHSISYDKMNNNLWVGTLSGLSIMYLDELRNYINPPSKVIITKIALPDTSFAFNDSITFNPSQNNILLKLTSFNYSSPSSIKFEYKFENSKQWIATNSPVLDFAYLSSGEYRLLLRASNLHNLKSEITSFNFVIKAPFWKTKYFYAGIILCAIILLIFISYKRIKYIKTKSNEKLEAEKNISSLKHQALSASMNPHFIFNTLNSIQYYMDSHTKEESNEYLVNFSRLIRMNLDLAGNTFIPLETEIQRLELYLKYEKLRFGDRLDYKINIESGIKPGILFIPNMILQPFVENSIWHGLLPKQGSGLVTIDIRKKGILLNKYEYTAIIINITDDGIGLTESAKHKKSNHISKGINIIKERLELLAPEIKDSEFINIHDRDDNVSGTTVTIRLTPGQYKEDSSCISEN